MDNNQYRFTSITRVEPSNSVKRVWLFSFLIILILISMLFLPWQQTVKGTGSVTSFDPTERDYSILSPVDGFIEKFYVKENQFVKKGEPLFKMVDLDSKYLLKLQNIEIDLKSQLENIRGEVENLDQQIVEAERYLESGKEVYVQKILQVEKRVKSLKLQRVSLEKKHEVESSNLKRVETLYRDGIESKRAFELVENSYAVANAELKKIEIDILVEKRNINILEDERDKFLSDTQNRIYELKSRVLNAENREKSLNQQIINNSTNIERYKNSEVVAPKDGYVVRILRNDKNLYLKKGEPTLHFAPLVTEKSILLKVTDFNMPLIKEGLPVRIMFHGWPALQISGWPKIQFGSFGGVVKKVEHISHENGFYYAYVVEDPKEPWPKGDVLRIGTRATAWVRLSVVPIWYQLWRSINALPPKMVYPNEERY